MERFEHLKTINHDRQNDEIIVTQKIKSGEDPYFFIPQLESTYVVFAINSAYVVKDFDNSRAYFYKAARIAEYMSVRYDRRIIDSGINQISYALLSDCSELIQRYSILRNSKNDELNIGFQLPNAIQNILLGNIETLEVNIRNLERFVKVPRFRWWGSLVQVFNGFLNENAQSIEEGLHEMLQTDKKRNDDPLITRFFSPDTAGLCKLAWIKGYEIDLKSEMVPLESMPIKPLDHYEDYEFLK